MSGQTSSALGLEHLNHHFKEYIIFIQHLLDPFLCLIDILVMITKLSRQFMDNLLENHRVNVLAQHVQQEEVTHLGLLDDDVDALLLDQSEPNVQKVGLEIKMLVVQVQIKHAMFSIYFA